MSSVLLYWVSECVGFIIPITSLQMAPRIRFTRCFHVGNGTGFSAWRANATTRLYLPPLYRIFGISLSKVEWCFEHGCFMYMDLYMCSSLTFDVMTIFMHGCKGLFQFGVYFSMTAVMRMIDRRCRGLSSSLINNKSADWQIVPCVITLSDL